MQVTCPHCRGRGFVGQPCSNCHGSGTREDSFEPAFQKSQLLDLRPSFFREKTKHNMLKLIDLRMSFHSYMMNFQRQEDLPARSSRLDSAEGETHSDAMQNALREWQLANVFLNGELCLFFGSLRSSCPCLLSFFFFNISFHTATDELLVTMNTCFESNMDSLTFCVVRVTSDRKCLWQYQLECKMGEGLNHLTERRRICIESCLLISHPRHQLPCHFVDGRLKTLLRA